MRFCEQLRKKDLVCKYKDTKEEIEPLRARAMNSVILITGAEGVFWDKIKSQYPKIQDTAPLNLYIQTCKNAQ